MVKKWVLRNSGKIRNFQAWSAKKWIFEGSLKSHFNYKISSLWSKSGFWEILTKIKILSPADHQPKFSKIQKFDIFSDDSGKLYNALKIILTHFSASSGIVEKILNRTLRVRKSPFWRYRCDPWIWQRVKGGSACRADKTGPILCN